MSAHLPVPYTTIGQGSKWTFGKKPEITCKYFPRYELFSSVNFGPVSDGQTDGQKAMHMSPLCISTDVIKYLMEKNTFQVNQLQSPI